MTKVFIGKGPFINSIWLINKRDDAFNPDIR